MARSDSRVLSEPCRVMFAGWESTTTRLQQAGWSLSVEQNFREESIRLAMRFEPCRLYMMAESQRFGFYRHAEYRDQLPVFDIRYCATEITVQMIDDLSMFRPIDAQPQFTNAERRSIEDFGIFATPLARTEEIIVEPETVTKLLEKIKKLQAPELAAIRERNRVRERTQPMARQQFHAQILSLAA